jgi:hypothetical protein
VTSNFNQRRVFLFNSRFSFFYAIWLAAKHVGKVWSGPGRAVVCPLGTSSQAGTCNMESVNYITGASCCQAEGQKGYGNWLQINRVDVVCK